METRGDKVCAACGSNDVAHFCAQCGHRLREGRATVFDFFQDILNSIVKGDFKTLRSTLALVARPGTLALGAAEQTARFVSPVKAFFAAVLFFTAFYAVIPYQFAQIDFVTAQEYGFTNPELAPESGLQPRIYFFAPTVQTLVSHGVREEIEAQGPQATAARGDLWPAVLEMVQSPRAEADLARYLSAVMAYAPLSVLIPIILLNALIYRRKRYLADHVWVAFEVAAFALIVMAFVQALVAGLHLFEVQIWTYDLSGPMMFGVVPLFFLGVIVADRRFYRTSWVWIAPKTLLIVISWFALTLTIGTLSMIQAVSLLGQTPA